MGNKESHPNHGQPHPQGQSRQPYPSPAAGGYPPPGGNPTGYPSGQGGPPPVRTFQQKYGFIPDSFETIEQVQSKLREVGLESSNLIISVDYTKSNEWTGKRTFQGRCLHTIDPRGMNPYEQAIQVIGETLEPFDEDNLIPCFGFGDVTTHGDSVFSFNPDNRPCQGVREVLPRYRAITPHVQLSGPTSFAPAIESAVRIVEESGGQYHVLLIIADGQVTRSADTPIGHFSPQEKATVDAIVAASHYPLSIILVGVGDGPWDVMHGFDNLLPARKFDNFQFVDFSQLMASGASHEQQKVSFALHALMEVPLQFKACSEMGLLGKRTGRMPPTPPLPPPPRVLQADAAGATAGYGAAGGYGAAAGYPGGGYGASGSMGAPPPPYGQQQQQQQQQPPSTYGQGPPGQTSSYGQPPPSYPGAYSSDSQPPPPHSGSTSQPPPPYSGSYYSNSFSQASAPPAPPQGFASGGGYPPSSNQQQPGAASQQPGGYSPMPYQGGFSSQQQQQQQQQPGGYAPQPY